jgi:hypothetical protein
MSKALAFARLDYITVKPYLTLKNLFLLAAVLIIYSGITESLISIITITMVFAAIYSSYPFVVGDKSNIDALYSTLSIKRDTVVTGRYIFAFSLILCAGVISNAAAFVILTVTKGGYVLTDSLFITAIMFMAFSVIIGLQMPIYFKFGYTKAKFTAYLPLLFMPLVVFLFTSVFRERVSKETADSLTAWAYANPIWVAVIAIGVWAVLMNLSYSISLAGYKKREF